MKRNTRQYVEDIDRMIDSLTALRRALPELERRNRHEVGGDGYPSGGVGGASGGGISKPTERAALSRRPADPVRRWSREILTELDRAAVAISAADGRRRLAFAGIDADRCIVCNEPEQPGAPLRDDRCPKDYQYRRRNGTDRNRALA